MSDFMGKVMSALLVLFGLWTTYKSITLFSGLTAFIFGIIGLSITVVFALFLKHLIKMDIIQNKNTKKMIIKEREEENNYKKFIEKYRQEFLKSEIPENTISVKLLEKFSGEKYNIKNWEYYTWIDNDNLYLFPKDRGLNWYKYTPKLEVIFIEQKDIVSYFSEGEYSRDLKISGGGGPSLEGAIVGGLLGGSVGSIIRSREKTKEIKSEIMINDTRKTILVINDNGNKTMVLDSKSCNSLYIIIPEKERSVVENIMSSKIISQINKEQQNESGALEKARILKQMLSEGLITDEHYQAKINEIINNN